ncbi:MAG: hypothetical protein ACPGJS_14165, partial [Flammeovirgaceae bacterium]
MMMKRFIYLIVLFLGLHNSAMAQKAGENTAICQFQLHIESDLSEVLGLDTKTLLGIYTQSNHPESKELVD